MIASKEAPPAGGSCSTRQMRATLAQQWPSGRLGQPFARRRRGGVRPQQRKSESMLNDRTHKDHIVAKVRDGSNHQSNYKLL